MIFIIVIQLDGSCEDKTCSVFLSCYHLWKREVFLIVCFHFVFVQQFMMTMDAFVLELFLLLDLTNLLYKNHDG